MIKDAFSKQKAEAKIIWIEKLPFCRFGWEIGN
jgi:hypothetical protein